MVDVEQVRARVAAASPGQWQRHGCDVWRDGDTTPLLRGRDDSARTRQQADADAEFVAHARQDVLDLLELLSQPSAAAAAEQRRRAPALAPDNESEPLATAPGPFAS